ncbi:hypothetical protein QQ020_22060 [Fulvivirgaceae bacterium BMA12]|uniref:Outer membrane protein beta-barrel domain-containing protein n=1 Tax=Agaribacillus aureus TaxID=3051825 RepID=A0ABT8LAJ6_9BACT|nr:hypothetical protein [Fulvivirgaceae bacterium BMA12]
MKVILFIATSIFTCSLYAQKANHPLSQRIESAQVGLFVHSISLPFSASNHFVGLNRLPGISAGVGLDIGKNQKKLDAKYSVAFSAYHQKNLHNGFELNNILLLQYELFPGFHLEGGPGLGYLHTFEDAPVYRLEGGEYQQVRSWGRAQVTASMLLGIFVPVSQRIGIVTNYQFLFQWPFATKAGVFFIPQSRINLGTRININLS